MEASGSLQTIGNQMRKDDIPQKPCCSQLWRAFTTGRIFGRLSFLFALCVSSAASGAPGDEQWDDSFGATTNLWPGALAAYQGKVYACTYNWDGSNLSYWSPQLGGFGTYFELAV